MSDYEISNVDPNQELAEQGSDNFWLIVAIGLGLTTIGIGIKDFFTSRKLKQEREKNKLYQEALKKHQAQINELKNEDERREYRDRLWAEIQAEMEE